MKYMLLMAGTKADIDSYTKWSKEDLQASMAFMRAFSKELKDTYTDNAVEGVRAVTMRVSVLSKYRQ